MCGALLKYLKQIGSVICHSLHKTNIKYNRLCKIEFHDR